MHNALVVRCLQCLSDLLGDRQSFINRNRPLSNTVGKRRSLDQFHDEGFRVVGELFSRVVFEQMIQAAV